MRPIIQEKIKEIAYQCLLFALGGVAIYFILFIKSETAVGFWNNPLLFFYTIFVTVFQLSRVVGAMFYNSPDEKTGSRPQYEPEVTFVIPCKDEEKVISRTVQKCFEADYPKRKIEVVVINDGSVDKTLSVLKGLKKKYKNLIVVNWEKNRGKRHGMHAGFKRAKGEIVIQLDSDSYIEPKTFRNFIKPFENSKIGAVCAHADPENADKNLITKMQAAYYFISFRILKAAESTFMTVFCCSGCSSAYRKSVVGPIMDKWLSEKFLGLPVTWGDDRALTHWVLKKGYKTIYTDKVQAYTVCPDTLKMFLKQQVRWKKGWFVNSMIASRFIYKKQPFVALTYFFPLVLVTLITPFMATKALVYNPIFRGITPVFYMLGILMVAVIISLYYRYVAKENKYWKYIFVWSGINMVFLSFVLFYALLTIQNRRWETR